MRNAHLIYCAVLHDYCTVKSMYVRRTSFSETAKLAKTGTWRYVCMVCMHKKEHQNLSEQTSVPKFSGGMPQDAPSPPLHNLYYQKYGPHFYTLKC